MWRITKESIYREWGRAILQDFVEHSTVTFGEEFSSLDDVNKIPPPRRDNMGSFWPVSEVVLATRCVLLTSISGGDVKVSLSFVLPRRSPSTH